MSRQLQTWRWNGLAPPATPPRQRVALGARRLDEQVPGWADRIRRPVQVANAWRCPLGQVFAAHAHQQGRSNPFVVGRSALFPFEVNQVQATVRYGFLAFTRWERAQLGWWWELEVARRRHRSPLHAAARAVAGVVTS